MGMSEFYGSRDDKESLATIHRALELGVTLLDTADIYGVRQRFLHFGATRPHPHALCTLEALDIGVTPFSWLIRKGVYYFP